MCVDMYVHRLAYGHAYRHVHMHMRRHVGSVIRLWFMVERERVDSRDGCRSDPGGYDLFSRIGSVTAMDRGMRVRVGVRGLRRA